MSIVIQNLEKYYGSQRVLNSVTETFEQARISVLLGPSGCGKTTTLRCLAGLERPSAGRIDIAGRVVYQDQPAVWVPPESRRVSMVFQSYAIWPHMTVFENVSLPLRAAGAGRRAIEQAVSETLRLVGLRDYADRSATQLSGGQQQRVALARCIVSESPLILMDEPLSNLDAKLRISMRTEIRELQRRLERTVLFVTHDQEEAMSIADTVYLYRDGSVVQKGAPKQLYDYPATRYAAEFLGRANIIEQFEWTLSDGCAVYTLPGGVALPSAADSRPAAGSMLCIRPEKWRLVGAGQAGALPGRIAYSSFVGDRTEYRIDTPAGPVSVVELNAVPRRVGDEIGLAVAAEDIRVVME